MTVGAAGNINTPEYWDAVYRREWETGQVGTPEHVRDYGPMHDAIVRLIPEGATVLDIACGAGVLCRKIKQRVPSTSVLGVDFSAFTIEQNLELDSGLGIDYRRLDIRNELPSLGRMFDVVTMCEVLEHLDEPERVTARALSLVRPGGLFVLTCPHDDDVPHPEHVRRWGHNEVFHLLTPYSDTISFVRLPRPRHKWLLAYLTKQETA